MAQRVTIQDIANALGLSRNTVSKAINNTGVLSDTTRERILQKAAEMGYKQFSYANFLRTESESISQPEENSIAILAGSYLGASHFASTMLDKFQREMLQLGYSTSMHRVLPEELRERQLPATLNPEKNAGLICFEIFDYDYARMICESGLPTLFVDTPVAGLDCPLKSDILYMENSTSVQLLVREVVARGKTRLGFVGNPMHCQSFYERATAFGTAVHLLKLEYNEQFCVFGGEKDDHIHLKERFAAMPELPEVFFCANDYTAVEVKKALQELGYTVPKDVWLCGFDDAPEASIITPPLTTVHIHSQTMGFTAAQLLVSRIREPSLNYRTVYTETDPVFRESTGH